MANEAVVTIQPRAHALLSASSAYRWTVCTKAARFEDEFKDSSGWAAQEGTIAHAIGEFCLLNDVDTDDETVIAANIPEIGQLIAHHLETDEPDGWIADLESMKRYTQEYVDYVRALPGEKYIEQRVDFSHIVPEGFGTSDAIVLQGDVADVVDLKFGKGKKVYANGPQAKLYAIGAINDLGFIFDNVKTVRIHIHQPRLDWVDVHEMTIEELNEYAEWIKGRAEEAFSGNGVFVSGDHCDFCRARKVCKARAEANMAVAMEEFSEPCPSGERLTIEEIAGLLPLVDQIAKWCGDIKDYALEQALSGNTAPGYKLVAGRSTRRWSDEVVVAEAMRGAGLTNDQIYNMKIIGMTEAEKLVGKKSEIFNLAVKAAGAPTLVPVSDKRPALSSNTAQDDFGE